MADTRPLSPDEVNLYKSKGIDATGAIATLDDDGKVVSVDKPAQQQAQQQTNTDDKDSYIQTGLKTLRAHAGGMMGGGAGMAAFAAAPFTEGLSLVPSLIGTALAATAGSALGQKAQELALGDTQKQWEQEQQQSAQENPKTALATDITGSALAGGGWPSIKNPVLAAGQLFGRNALSAVDKAALSQVGEEALSQSGITQLAVQKAGKEAIRKIAGSALVNPAINTGIDLVTGQPITTQGVVSQVIGGGLFSEPSRLGRFINGERGNTKANEPLPETGSKDFTETPSNDTGVSPFNAVDTEGNFIAPDEAIKAHYLATLGKGLTPKQISALTPEAAFQARVKNYQTRQMSPDAMRQALHEDYMKNQNPVDVNNPTDKEADVNHPTSEYEANPPIATDSNKEIIENQTAKTGMTTDEMIQAQMDRGQIAKQMVENEARSSSYKPIFPSETIRPSDEAQKQPTQNELANVTDKGKSLADAVREYEQERMLNGIQSDELPKLQATAKQRAVDFEKAKAELAAKYPQAQGPNPLENPNTKRILNPETMIGNNLARPENRPVPEPEQTIVQMNPKLEALALKARIQQAIETGDINTAGQLTKEYNKKFNVLANKPVVEGEQGGPFEQQVQQSQDNWDTRLQKLKIDTNGKMYGGLSGLGATVWNGSIDAIRLGIKAGKAIHEAIQDGIDWIKKNHPGVKFDENEYKSKAIEHLTKKEQNAPTERSITKDIRTERQGTDEHGSPPETSRSDSLQSKRGEKEEEIIPRTRQLRLTEALNDKIREGNSPEHTLVANQLKKVENTVDQRTGKTLNKVLDVAEKVHLTKEDDARLSQIRDWQNKTGRDVPDNFFTSPAQKAVWNTYKQVHNEIGEHRLAINEPVIRGGVPTKLKQLPNANPLSLSPKIADMYRNGTDKAAIAAHDAIFLKNLQDHGVGLVDAKAELARFKGTLQGSMNTNHSNLARFNGARIAHGTPIPLEFAAKGFLRNLEPYYKRMALDNAMYEHVESNPKVMAALGETRDPWGKAIPANPNDNVIANSPAVRQSLEHFQGSYLNPTTHNEGAVTSLATTSMVSSPSLVMHVFTTNMMNGPLAHVDNPVQLVKTLHAMVSNISEGIQHAKEGNAIRMTARSVSDVYDTNATWAERLQAASKALRNVSSLNDSITRLNMGAMQAGFEEMMPGKINRANAGDITQQQYLKKLDPSYKVGKQYDLAERQKLASLAIAYTHGTKDTRTMPGWMLSDTETSGFFSLAHWSIAQTNRFMTDVFTPATKGHLAPLINSLVGGVIGGYMIKELREAMRGKHSDIPDLNEIAAGKGGLMSNKGLVAYNCIAACQYAGFAGLLGQAAKYPFDIAYKNNSQGAIFPLDEIASDLTSHIKMFFSAKANDPNFDWGAASMQLMTHVLTTDVQLTKLGFNQMVDKGFITGTPAEKKQLADKLGQLRRFEQISNLPFDQETPSEANPYMSMKEKEFKREPDIDKAMAKLPDIISSIFKNYGSNPGVLQSKLEALKQNQYETFPSIEDHPYNFKLYMNYLTQLKGDVGANKDFNEYMKHKVVNQVKAGAVP